VSGDELRTRREAMHPDLFVAWQERRGEASVKALDTDCTGEFVVKFHRGILQEVKLHLASKAVDAVGKPSERGPL